MPGMKFAAASAAMQAAWRCDAALFVKLLQDHEDGPALIEGLKDTEQLLDEALSHAKRTLDACAEAASSKLAATSKVPGRRPWQISRSGKLAPELSLADVTPDKKKRRRSKQQNVERAIARRQNPAPAMDFEDAASAQADDDDGNDNAPPGSWDEEDDQEGGQEGGREEVDQEESSRGSKRTLLKEENQRFHRDASNAFFASVPEEAHTEEEEELREALLEVLDGWTDPTPPSLSDLLTDGRTDPRGASREGRFPRIRAAKDRCLPRGVSVRAWIEQRIGEEVEVDPYTGRRARVRRRGMRTTTTRRLEDVAGFLRQKGGRCPFPVVTARFLFAKKTELESHFDITLKEGGNPERPQDYTIELRDAS